MQLSLKLTLLSPDIFSIYCYNNNQYTAYTYPHWHILCAQRSQMLSIFFLSAMLILLPKLFIEFNHHIVDIPFFLHCFPTLFFLHCWHPIFATEVDHGAYPPLHQQKPPAKPEKPRLIQNFEDLYTPCHFICSNNRCS